MSELVKSIGNKIQRFSKRASFAGIWTISLSLLFFILLYLGPLTGILTYYPGDFFKSQNRLYLLSAAAQCLATILALGITATLVSLQLVSQMFTPKIIRLKLKEFYFWSFIGVYTLSIIWLLILMGWIKTFKSQHSLARWSIDLGLLLSLASLLYLVPFIHSTIKNLQPVIFINKFLKKKDYLAIEEALHSSVDEGFSTIVKESIEAINVHILARMAEEAANKRKILADDIKVCYVAVGVRAFEKNELSSLSAIMQGLKELTRICVVRLWTLEAEVFNEALAQIYDSIQ